MSISDEILPADASLKRFTTVSRIPGTQRPPFSWSDIWRAPLHDFPIRDEILYQYLPLSGDMEVLEIGPGSGYTAFRLARQVRHVTLVDVASEGVAELRAQLGHLPNVRCVCSDVTRPGLREHLGQDFHAAFGLDVFEYLADPAASLRNLAALLRPGGQLLLTYPNVSPPAGDGVTYFSLLADLERLLEQAGFREWQIFGVKLRPLAAAMYRVLHEWPLQRYRQLRQGEKTARPQTYERTWAFQHRRCMLPYKVPVHMWWAALAPSLRLGGDVFVAEPLTDEILGRQLVIRAGR